MAEENVYSFKNPCVFILNNHPAKDTERMDVLVDSLEKFFVQNLGYDNENGNPSNLFTLPHEECTI
jgi:hypothetical protein